MTDNPGLEFLKVNEKNLVKISIKICVRLNERKLSIIFFVALKGGGDYIYTLWHQYLSNMIKCLRHSPLSLWFTSEKVRNAAPYQPGTLLIWNSSWPDSWSCQAVCNKLKVLTTTHIVTQPSPEQRETSHLNSVCLSWNALCCQLDLGWAVSLCFILFELVMREREKYCVQTWEVSGWNVLIKISDWSLSLSLISDKKNCSNLFVVSSQFGSLISAEISDCQ